MMTKETLQGVVSFALANGKRNMVVDLETLQALLLECASMDITAAIEHESGYREGYLDALSNYAVWINGEQFVGVMRRPLKEVIAEFYEQQIPVRY